MFPFPSISPGAYVCFFFVVVAFCIAEECSAPESCTASAVLAKKIYLQCVALNENNKWYPDIVSFGIEDSLGGIQFLHL